MHSAACVGVAAFKKACRETTAKLREISNASAAPEHRCIGKSGKTRMSPGANPVRKRSAIFGSTEGGSGRRDFLAGDRLVCVRQRTPAGGLQRLREGYGKGARPGSERAIRRSGLSLKLACSAEAAGFKHI